MPLCIMSFLVNLYVFILEFNFNFCPIDVVQQIKKIWAVDLFTATESLVTLMILSPCCTPALAAAPTEIHATNH